MASHREQRAAALESIARALIEMAALEREPETRSLTIQRSAASTSRTVELGDAAEDPRMPEHHLPAGMTTWVNANHVARAVGCSLSKAHEYLRAAAGRRVGTGRLLRVPVDVWEAWARDNLIEGLRRERRGTAPSYRRDPPPVDAVTVGAAQHHLRRRDLGPTSRAESRLPLIRPLVSATHRR
jgi:hypothetical protein